MVKSKEIFLISSIIIVLIVIAILAIKLIEINKEDNQEETIIQKTNEPEIQRNQEETKASRCGNRICELTETYLTCPNDCLNPEQSQTTEEESQEEESQEETSCGNDICESEESCSTCVQDCGGCEYDLSVSLDTEEIVFDWTTDKCENYDLPDGVTHAIRMSNEIVFDSGNDPKNYFSYGPDFDNLERVCTSTHTSGDELEAEKFHAREWIASIYSDDGQTIHALVHNEYHDSFYEYCKPGVTDSSNPCWYNSFGYAASTDGGKTFRHSNGPNHVIAFPPIKWDPESNQNGRIPGPYGYFEPSSIVKKDNYYYSVFFAITSPIPTYLTRGTCLMRTNNLNNPSSWRFWDGQGFNGEFKNPYTNQESEWCTFVSKENINSLHGSLTYNTYLEKYIVVGSGVFNNENNPQTCGFWFTLSDNLITWEKPQLLKEGPLGHPPCDNLGYSYVADNYPAIIDHDDTSISFENTGKSFYLYFSRHKQGLDRDLIRTKVTLDKT